MSCGPTDMRARMSCDTQQVAIQSFSTYAALEVNEIVSMAPPADEGGSVAAVAGAGVDASPAEEVDEEYDDDFEDADVESPTKVILAEP